MPDREKVLLLQSIHLNMDVVGPVVQLVRMSPCHGEGRGFESRPARKKKRDLSLKKGVSLFFLNQPCVFLENNVIGCSVGNN